MNGVTKHRSTYKKGKAHQRLNASAPLCNSISLRCNGQGKLFVSTALSEDDAFYFCHDNETMQTAKKARWRSAQLPVWNISEIQSPLSNMRPSGRRVFFLIEISSASSKTMFMYSSKPKILPSILVSFIS